jgi:uncharacterized membrane protein YfcA
MDMQNLIALMAIALASFALSFYGATIGLILGNLRLPLLIYFFPSTTAGMATNLTISGMGALTGSIRHAREGRISLRLLALMGIPSILGAFLGAAFLLKIDATWAHVFIGGFLIASGLSLVSPRAARKQPVVVFGWLRMGMEVMIGLVIGFLAAVTGLMLGSLRLPMMIRVLKVDTGVAVGTNMAIGCLTAFAGAGCLWPRGESFPLLPLLIIVPPTILGGYLGAYLTGKVRKDMLQRLVGGTIALVGVAMAAEGVWRTLLA